MKSSLWMNVRHTKFPLLNEQLESNVQVVSHPKSNSLPQNYSVSNIMIPSLQNPKMNLTFKLKSFVHYSKYNTHLPLFKPKSFHDEINFEWFLAFKTWCLFLFVMSYTTINQFNVTWSINFDYNILTNIIFLNILESFKLSQT